MITSEGAMLGQHQSEGIIDGRITKEGIGQISFEISSFYFRILV
jgi:hypothetical protein